MIQDARRRRTSSGTLVLLDVACPDLNTCLRAVMAEIEGAHTLEPAYRDAVRLTLKRHADLGPDVLEASVAVIHEQIDVPGPPIQVLARLVPPLDLPDEDGRPTHFLWVLLSNQATHRHLDRVAEFAHLMHDEDFRRAALEAVTADELDVAYARGLDEEVHFAHVPEELRPTGRLFGGVIQDVRRRLPWWVDDFRAGLRVKVLASTLFMYFACLAPAVAFGGLLATLTGGQIGAVETLVACAVCGALWALLSGQPLAIVGPTGPNVVFTGILYALCLDLGIPFLPTAAWVGLWTAAFLIIAAATDASSLSRFFTRFTDETFAALISLIFIYEAMRDLARPFADGESKHATALLSLLLALGTFALAVGLSRFRRSPFLRYRVREFLSDFGPAIAIVAGTGVAFLMYEVDLARLQVPSALRPTADRGWFVNPFEAPIWVWGASAIPAVLLTILIWMNQNITARLVNSPDHRLRKGAAYHLDIGVMGLLIGLMSLFGLPWVVGAVVRSLNHVKSLAIVEGRAGKERIVGVVENRLSNLGISFMLGVSLFLLPLLAVVPMAVLFGMFLFMGIGSLGGNQFYERVKLWLMDPELYPPTYYLRAVPTPAVHSFTAIQLACLAVLWVVKASAVGILFPFFVALLVPVRMAMGALYKPEHLALLDAGEEPDDEIYREVGT